MDQSHETLMRPSYEPGEHEYNMPVGPPYPTHFEEHIPVESYEMLKSPSVMQTSHEDLMRQDHLQTYPPRVPHWHTGFYRRFPWKGIGALIISLAATIVAIVILIRSDGTTIDSWNVQPSVIVSIAAAIFRTTLEYALAEAAIIFWWNRAIKGSTIKDLHRVFEQASGFWDAALSGRHLNVIAFCTIMVTVCAAIGPLLQRATSVTTLITISSTTLVGHIASELPQGYTANLGALQYDLTSVSIDFAKVLSSFEQNKALNLKDLGLSGCDGNCTAVIQAAGLIADCSKNSTSWGINGTSADSGVSIFDVSSLWESGGVKGTQTSNETITLMIAIAGDIDSHAYTEDDASTPTENCTGTLNTVTCTLSEAVVSYNTVITSGVIQLNNSSPYLNKVKDAPQYAYINSGGRSTLGGLSLYLDERYSANASLQYAGLGRYPPPSSLPSDTAMLNFTLENLNSFAAQYLTSNKITTDQCNYTWSDPTDVIVAQLNEIMFRTALQAGMQNPNGIVLPGAKLIDPDVTYSTLQNIDAQQSSSKIIYRTHYGYMIGAVVVMGIGIISVFVSFFGWWRLGRDLSLNPFETAKAFDSPLLIDREGEIYHDVNAMVKDMGDRRIMYGEAQAADGNRLLVFSEPERLKQL